MNEKTKGQLLAEKKLKNKRIAELQSAEAISRLGNDVYKRQAHVSSKRVKELNCLYSFKNMIETPGISLPEILHRSVNLLPPPWQYPQITCVRITLNDQEYKTKNFRETKWKLASEIKVDGKRAGSVEVFYLEQQPIEYEGKNK